MLNFACFKNYIKELDLKYLIIILLILAPYVFSQQNNKGIEIAAVTITGNNDVSDEVIKISSGLLQGKVVYGEDLQSAIKKLWSLNFFSVIRIESKNIVDGKAFLEIFVTEYPKLTKVRIEGNKEFDKDDLEPNIKLFQGQSLKPDDLQSVKNKIIDFYKSKNFLLTTIDIKQNYTSDKEVELVINVNEGEEVLIEEIKFFGNSVFDDDDLKDEFENTKEDRWWRDGEYRRDDYEADLDLLSMFYKNNGYRDFEVLKDSVYYSDDYSKMYIDIYVKEGQKYYFGDVTFEGNTIFSDDELAFTLEFEKGEEYSEEKFQMSIYNNLSTMYMDRGYLRSRIIPQEQTAATDTVDFVMKIVEGGKSRVRMVNIKGNSRTNEKVIRRALAIYPGDVFNKSKIIRSQRELMMLNYFQNVIPDIERQVSENEVDLVVSVEEKSTEQIQTSIAYSESDGFIGSIGLTFNNFSLENPFIQGDGQKLSTNIEFGSEYYKYSLSFEEPWLMDRPTLVGGSAYYLKRGEDYSDVIKKGGSLKLGRRFSTFDNWVKGIWVYQLEETKYENVESDTPSSYDIFEGKSIISSSVTQYINRDNRNQAQFPDRGTVFSIMTKLSGGPFGGDEAFHKHKFEFKWFQPIIDRRLVFYTSYVVGVMDRLSSSSYISPGEYFYLGGGGLNGGEPLRGYDENSIGPRDENYYLGGKSLFKATTELRLLITEDPMLIYTLAFLDAGNLWSDFKNADIFDLKKGAGFGIRVFVPMVGMLGFDFAWGLDHFEFDDYGKRKSWRDEFRTHFRMGTNL